MISKQFAHTFSLILIFNLLTSSTLWSTQPYNYLERCKELGETKPDSIIFYARQVLENQSDQTKITKSHFYLAKAEFLNGNYQKSTEHIELSLSDKTIESNPVLWLNCLYQKGLSKEYGNEMENAQYYFEKCKILADSLGLLKFSALVYNKYGNIQETLDFEKQAIEHYKTGLNLCKSTECGNILYTLETSLFDLLLMDKENTEKVLKTARSKFNSLQNSNNLKYVDYAYILSKYYLKNNNLELAKFFSDKCLQADKTFDFDPTKKSLYRYYASQIAIKNKDFNTAEIYNKESTAFAKQVNNIWLIENNNLNLLEILEAKGNYKEAFLLSKDFYSRKNNLLNKARVNAVMDMEKELIVLENEKEIFSLTNEKDKLKIRNARISAFLVISTIIGLSFFLFNIYSQKNNQIISSQKTELEELNFMKDKLFSLIGHDMKNATIVFQGISKKIDYLLKKKDYDTLSKLGENLEQSYHLLNRQLGNFINWTLSEQGLIKLNNININLEEAISEIIEDFYPLYSTKEIDIELVIEDSVNVTLDPNIFQHIISNVIDNAIKFSNKNDKIHISTKSNQNNISIIIKDTGIGMDEESIQSIFNLKSNKSRQGTNGEMGSGIGMILVKDLIELNGGQIYVESQIGIGSKITLEFPLN